MNKGKVAKPNKIVKRTSHKKHESCVVTCESSFSISDQQQPKKVKNYITFQKL